MRHPGIRATQSAPPGTQHTREYFAGEAPGPVSSDDVADNVNLASLNATLSAGDWVVFWTCELRSDNAGLSGATGFARIALDGTEIDSTGQGCYNPADVGQWSSAGGFFIHAADGDPVAFTLDVRGESGAFATTATGRNGRIAALKLTAEDEWVEDVAPQVISSATPVDGVTLNFTPGTTGSYLLLGFQTLASGVASEIFSRLSDGLVASPGISAAGLSSSETLPVTQMWLRTALSGAQSYRLQAWTDSGIPVTQRSGRILALRLDGFTKAHRTTSNGDEDGAEASYTDSLVLRRTIPDGDFLALAAWGEASDDGAGELYKARFLDAIGAANSFEATIRAYGAANPMFTARIGAYAAGDRRWAIQRLKPVDGNDPAIIRAGAMIAVLQLT